MRTSKPMKVPCQNLTISNVTRREIGTKLLKRHKVSKESWASTYVKMRIHVPVVFIKRRPQLEFQSSFVANPRYFASFRLLIIQVVPMVEPIILQMT